MTDSHGSPRHLDVPSDTTGLYRTIFNRPPGWLMHAMTAVAVIGMMAAFSAPGSFIFAALGYIILCLALAAAWFFRLIVFVYINRRRQWRQALKIGWRHWAIGPLAALLTAALIALQLPLWLRFNISRDGLSRVAHRALAAGPKPLGMKWDGSTVIRAGAFYVEVVQVTSSGEVDFRVPNTEFFRSFSGFAYCPAGNPSDPEGSFEPLGDSWYVWHTSW